MKKQSKKRRISGLAKQRENKAKKWREKEKTQNKKQGKKFD